MAKMLNMWRTLAVLSAVAVALALVTAAAAQAPPSPHSRSGAPCGACRSGKRRVFCVSPLASPSRESPGPTVHKEP